MAVNKSNPNLSDIYSPIMDSLSRVKCKISSLKDDKYSDVTPLVKHVITSNGKKVRPAVTVLSSKFHPNDGVAVETMAAAVELLHIATLIHDDTVDNSDMRRGKGTVSSLWGVDEAVVLGDYMFAASATFVCDTGNIRVIRRFAETIMELSKGQMNELIHAFSSDQNMDDYYERIYNKTASLFATAAESGAILSGADEDIVSAMRTYGVNLGIGFQLIDDILDIASSKEKTGKPVGNDIAQGITTLPVLVYQKNNPQDDSVQRYFEKPEDLLQANDILNRISTDSVVEECLDIAYKYKDKASQALEVLPNTTERDCLLDLLEYVFIDCRY